MTNYKRDVEQLKSKASMFWPEELSQKQSELSVIPKLLETQDQFIAILSIGVSGLEGLCQLIETSTFPANLFLKHLVVLSDFGGEMLQRVDTQFTWFFPENQLEYTWQEKTQVYKFKKLPVSGTLSNDKLGISGKRLLKVEPFDDLKKDVMAILLFGSMSIDDYAARILAKCDIGSYLGEPDKLEKYIKQRYIWVSRITSGSQSNDLGQIAQTFVKDYLAGNLHIKGLEIKSNGHIPGVAHSEDGRGRLTTFDLVVSKDKKKYIAIEIGFQVTTNSVIERKAGQARSRFEQIDKKGYKIAYVIDGAGNFQRENAVRTICEYGHCIVAFSKAELNVLRQFLEEYFLS